MTEAISRRFRALANENRLAIFEFLRQHRMDVSVAGPEAGRNVGDIARQFDLALSTVSHHLRVLHEAGLIRCEQRGQFTYCVIDWDVVEEMRGFFARDD